MNARSLVTIAIPAYNGAQLIGNAVRSALAQTYTQLEILIIDDNSTDTTAEEIDRFQDERIRYIRNHRNIGLVNNFRRVLEESRGEFICFLSQDDQIDPEFVEWAIETFSQYPKATFVFAATRFSGERSGQRVLPINGCLSGKDYIKFSLTQSKNLTFLCGALARRDAALKVGVADGLFFDWTLWLCLAEIGDVVYTPQLLSTHHYHPDKATRKFMKSYCRHCSELIKAVDGFVAGRQDLETETIRLANHCKQSLYSQYASILAHDLTLECREFLSEVMCFAKLRPKINGARLRIPKALLTFSLLKLGQGIQRK